MTVQIELPCWRLDGTTGSQCENLRHGYKVPKPSLAQEATGDRETRHGIAHGKRFYFCIPGLAHRAGTISLDEMIQQQKKCDRYMTIPETSIKRAP